MTLILLEETVTLPLDDVIHSDTNNFMGRLEAEFNVPIPVDNITFTPVSISEDGKLVLRVTGTVYDTDLEDALEHSNR